MKNLMEWVKPSSIDLISPKAILFTIELAFNAHLRDEEILRISMDDYMEKHPNIDGYRAEAKGDILYLVVYGTMNREAVMYYTTKE